MLATAVTTCVGHAIMTWPLAIVACFAIATVALIGSIWAARQ